MAFIVIFNGLILAYASQIAMVELEKLQNQFEIVSVKLNEIENRREPIVAFRATGVKNGSIKKNYKKYFGSIPGNFKYELKEKTQSN